MCWRGCGCRGNRAEYRIYREARPSGVRAGFPAVGCVAPATHAFYVMQILRPSESPSRVRGCATPTQAVGAKAS
ncbi:hypothetical protein [Kingella potus]|uniref:hypothetical protein n=1 Tax=Kingella potus TaxID=265175 RepID=UPI001FD2E279|nr:hypothetical protein [Kingella potus]UOP01359.1 hypothetical protein LVJ84_03715 [Kingella potus]